MEDVAGLTLWVQDNLLLLLTAVFLPLLNGLVTKLDARPGLKAAVNFAIAFVVALIDVLIDQGGEWTWQSFLVAWAVVAGVSHNAYKMIWKPAGGGVSDPVRLATPNAGLGNGAPVGP
jgi:hypothetical protein